MPVLRPSPSDYTTIVKALANAGAAVTNPQGFRPPSKGSVAFVNVSSVAALIRGSPRLASILPRAVVVAASAPAAIVPLANAGTIDAFVVKYDSSGTPLWARRLGGTVNDSASSVSTDSSGNIVVTGRYASNPLTLFAADGTTEFTTLTNSGSEDAFVVKYDSSGTPLWARRLSGVGFELVNSVSTDSSGNIVVGGQYASNPLTIFAANGTTEFTTLTNSGSNDAFVVKYDSSGTPLWARRLGGTGNDSANSVSTDSSGNIVVAGGYSSNPLTIFAANGTTEFTTLTNSGAFVVKYDSSGTPLWARRLGGTASDSANSVSTDSSGNIVVVGYYASNPLNIFAANGTMAFTLAFDGGFDVFVVKYDSTGTPLWARRMAGTGNDFVNSVSIDSSGNIVVGGQYASNPLTIFAANGTTEFTTLTNSGSSDAFVVKYDSAGTPLWARRLVGTGGDGANSVNTDSSGNIVVAGYYASNPLTIYNADGATEFTTLTNSGGNDSFVVKYDSAGTPLWARRLGGTVNDSVNEISTDSSGNIVVAGGYSSNPLTIT
jgi:hypothetical protein